MVVRKTTTKLCLLIKEMIKVLLVNPEIPMGGNIARTEQFPNGALLLLGTILKRKGYEAKVIHMTADGINLERLEDIVKGFKPDVVGLTATTFQSRTLREASRAVKRGNGDTRIVAGGCHISALISIGHSVATDYPDIDCFVDGEGDEIFEDIIEYGFDSKIFIPDPIKVLNTPPMDLALTDINKFSGAYPLGPQPGMFVMGSRGCPFRCTFCSRSVFGQTVRYREPVAVVDDVEKMEKDWGVKEIFFQDDTFNLNGMWAYEVLNLIIKRNLNKKLKFRTPCRVSKKLINLDLLRLMKEAGFWLIFFGVESGSQAMLDRMHKDITVEEIKRAFSFTRAVGMKAEASFIVGLPGETKETIQESIDLWKEIKPDWCSFTRAVPFPGTAFYKEVQKVGHLLVDNFDDIEAGKTLCRTDALTGDEIEGYAVSLDNMMLRRKLWHLVNTPKNLISILGDVGLKRGMGRAWQALHRAKL
jgi:radical SAM superfamily enzyme YgiQ (UPF0313 family)